MRSATVHPDATHANAATVLLAIGPRPVLVFLLRSLADRIEDGGRARAKNAHLDIGLAIRRLPHAALADATRRAYAGALRRLERWLAGRRLDDGLLAAYLGELFERGLAPASAKLVVHGVRRAVADCARSRRPCSENPAGPATEERLERFHREAGGRGRGQVRGVSWEEADGMCERAQAQGDLRGLRDAAMVAVASQCLLRVSEVSGLDVTEVSFRPDGTARARIRRSKTDQHGRGSVHHVCEDAAAWLRVWIEVAGIRTGPLFRALARGGRVSDQRLGPDSVRAAIKRRAGEAGIGGRMSGHSLRIGAAQSLAERDVSLAELQRAGRWKSPAMPGYYVRGQEASRGAVARLRGGVRKKSGKALAPPGTRVLGARVLSAATSSKRGLTDSIFEGIGLKRWH